MRLYLDTNILVFLTKRDHDDVSADVGMLLFDYSNQLFASTVCVHELIHLFQIGKLRPKKGDTLTKVEDFSQWLDAMNIGVRPVGIEHLRQFAQLPLYADHRDPNDRLIVAQAISDRMPLVTSDRKLAKYVPCGLDLVENVR